MSSSRPSNIVVTGLGVIASNGADVETFWSNVLQGPSTAALIESPDVTGLGSRMGHQIHDFDPLSHIEPKRARRMDRTSQLAVAAAQMAFAEAGLNGNPMDERRIGVYEGTSLGGMAWLFRQYDIYQERGLERVNPFTLTAAFLGAGSGEMAIHLGIKGPSMTVCTGSASGADAIGLAMESLRRGEADVMLAGGAETPFTLPIIALFNRVDVLSKHNENPGAACRPFDKDRDGFVLGEGSAFMVLETEEHALKRGARIRGVLAGFGRTCDAYHMNAPDPEGEGAAEAIRLAVKEAGLEPEQVDYVNAHGTGTRLNDPVESKAIKSALGDWGSQVPVSSTKPITGHLLGASGALEAAITLLAIESQTLPPNLNLENLDTECPLNIVTPSAVKAGIEFAVTNSYGFGGKNSTLIFRRFHG